MATATASPAHARRLSLSTRIFYGFGSVAFGVKDNGFSYFLAFFYAQVVGLPAETVGFDRPDSLASSVRDIGPDLRMCSSSTCSLIARMSCGRAAEAPPATTVTSVPLAFITLQWPSATLRAGVHNASTSSHSWPLHQR